MRDLDEADDDREDRAFLRERLSRQEFSAAERRWVADQRRSMVMPNMGPTNLLLSYPAARAPASDLSGAAVQLNAGLNLQRLGGSDMAAILGLSPYDTAFEPYSRIVLGVSRIRTPEEEERMKWGRLLESVVAAAYCVEHGLTAPMKGTSIDHPTREWQRYTPDFHWPLSRVLLEVKTCGERMAHRWGAEGTDQIPDEYHIQVQTYLEALNYERAIVVVLIGGQRMRSYEIARNLELGHLIVEAGERFWRDHILPKRPPEIDSSASAASYLAARYAGSPRGKIRPSTGAEDAIALKLRGTKTALDELGDEQSLLRNQLRAAIAEDKGIQGHWGRAFITAGDKPSLRVEFEGP